MTAATTAPRLSSKTFDCFTCQRNGYQERVYLAGKDANNKTIYVESDGITLHKHKFKQAEKTISDGDLTNVKATVHKSKEDYIIALLLEIRSKLNSLSKTEKTTCGPCTPTGCDRR